MGQTTINVLGTVVVTAILGNMEKDRAMLAVSAR
jgi:hypothetical protein